MLPSERRAEVRFPANYSAKLRVLTPLNATAMDVEVVDASMSGARIHVQENLLVGTIVQVSFKNSIVVAEVRNCIRSAEGYDAGLYISVFYDRDDPATHTSSGVRGRVTW